MSDSGTHDPRIYFAAERTFLAWIRTGLALMGFGFVVARFGIFLQEIVLDRGREPVQSFGVSVGLGVALVIPGVAVVLAASWRHVVLISAIKRGEAIAVRPSILALLLALALAVVGLLMAFFLIHARGAGASPNSKENPMQTQNQNGIITRSSDHSVDETVARVQSLLEQRNVRLFALVDHSGQAAKIGLKMPPTKLLIFGNPRGGTPVMLAAPTSAIDLPLKLLVWEDAQGKTWLSYNDPKYLQARHQIPADLVQNIGVVGALADLAAK
jgi:uncharacterized protein (DUF302 family)/uncharacterized membrane protein YidH (DUF202 family)